MEARKTELETDDKERSKRKVRGRKKTGEKTMANSSQTTVKRQEKDKNKMQFDPSLVTGQLLF